MNFEGLDARNVHSNYPLGVYLAITPIRLNLPAIEVINTETSNVDKSGFEVLINHLISLYNGEIGNQLAHICGVDAHLNYFELYEYILIQHKWVSLKFIYFIKENGLRELYYAFKNYNEAVDLKEGLFFAQLTEYNKGNISFEQFFEWTQETVNQEASDRKQIQCIINHWIFNNLTRSSQETLETHSLKINLPNFDTNISESLDLNSSVDLLKKHSNKKDVLIGYQETGRIFKKTVVSSIIPTDKTKSTLIDGNPLSSDNIRNGLIYQSLYNGKGLVLFNFMTDFTYDSLIKLTQSFDREDDLHTYFYGTEEFNKLDINNLITHNKIVFIQFPHMDKKKIEDIQPVFNHFLKIIDSISKQQKEGFPYSLFINGLYISPEMDNGIQHMLTTLNLLMSATFNSVIFKNNYHPSTDHIIQSIINNVENIIAMKHIESMLFKYLITDPISEDTLQLIENDEFYYFKNKKLSNTQKFKSFIIQINSDSF